MYRSDLLCIPELPWEGDCRCCHMYQGTIGHRKNALDTLVMCLVIFVPLVARMDAIEVSWLAWPIFVFPVVCGWIGDVLLQIEKFFLLIEIFLRLSPVQSLRGEICAARCFFGFDFYCCRLRSLRNKP